jgi:uncharacterized membrane protein required for colicin V production
MVSLSFFFYFLVLLFAIIGAMRGWAKEMLVSFSVFLAIFIISVLERYVPLIYNSFAQPGSISQFWMRVILVGVLVFFGYQTPNLSRINSSKFARERLQDTLLGLFLGAVNGYLIVGSLWMFLAQANYPFQYISPPVPGTPLGDAALAIMNWLPPRWLGPPTIYFAVALAFLFVIVVFI